jgi:hypothetical protein
MKPKKKYMKNAETQEFGRKKNIKYFESVLELFVSDLFMFERFN